MASKNTSKYYDKDGFDEDGYNAYGYNKHFIHKDGYDTDGYDKYGHHMDELNLTDIEEIEKDTNEQELNKKRKRRKVIKPTQSMTPYTEFISKIPIDNELFKDWIKLNINLFKKFLKEPQIDIEKQEYKCNTNISKILYSLLFHPEVKNIKNNWNLNARYSVYKYLSKMKDRYKYNNYKTYKNKDIKKPHSYSKNIMSCEAYIEENPFKKFKKANFINKQLEHT